MLTAVETDPVARAQHCQRRHQAAALVTAAARVQRHRQVGDQLVLPQQVKQHRQHRDRIPYGFRARHQQGRRGERRPQRCRQLWQAMARMTVPGQPPQVRRHDRVRRADQPVLPAGQPARPPSRLELGLIPGRAAFGRTADRPLPPRRPSGWRRSPARAPRPYHPAPSTTARTAERRSPSRPGPSPAISGDHVLAMTHTRRDRRPWTTTTGPADAAALPGGKPPRRAHHLEPHRLGVRSDTWCRIPSWLMYPTRYSPSSAPARPGATLSAVVMPTILRHQAPDSRQRLAR